MRDVKKFYFMIKEKFTKDNFIKKVAYFFLQEITVYNPMYIGHPIYIHTYMCVYVLCACMCIHIYKLNSLRGYETHNNK